MRGRNRGSVGACAAAVASVLICAEVSHADVAYDITALGLTDAQHRKADGYCYSRWTDYNDKGGVTGISSRYSGDVDMGRSAWFYENKVTTRIGLWDAAHTRSDGYASSGPMSITSRHQVLGNSSQYVGQYEGRTAWVYSRGVTQVVGLTDAEHTATDGMRSSYGYQQNEEGQAIGESSQYRGNGYVGTSAWFYSDGQTLRIGRTGSDAYGSSGESWNSPEYLGDGGHVAGWGGRYGSTGNPLGHTPWVYGSGQTLDIGLFDAEHISSDGKSDGRTSGVNSSGNVIGHNTRYSGAMPIGETAWIYRGGTATRIGLTGGIHTAPNGGRVSEPLKINSNGQAIGWSTQYVNGATGGSAWFFDGTTTREAGLTDSFHKIAGAGYNTPILLNDSGAVAGVSRQWREGGLSAFHYQNGVTTRIGLLDSKHVQPDGISGNTISLMNAVGQIAGIATRANNYSGATAWFYDPGVNQTYPLEFSESSSGYASSVVQFLSDDGVCLGEYIPYEGDQSLGYHAFYWSVAKGFHDLGSIEAGSFAAQGWERLYDGIVINGNGDVITKGTLGRQTLARASLMSGATYSALDAQVWGDISVMLTAVPEPSAVLSIIGLSSLLSLRVRSKR